MSGRPWYKRCGADFIEGTMGLTLEEKGAYSLCLDLIYSNGGPVADDDKWVAGICSVSVRKWKAIRQRLISTGKLASTGGRLSNARAEKELVISSKTPRKPAENVLRTPRQQPENQTQTNENNELEASIREDKSREDKKETPTALPPPTDLYAFQGSTIRLTGRHLEQWRSAFPHITLESELLALDEWAGEQGGQWFHAVSSALAKKERAARERINIRRTELEAGPLQRTAPDRRL